jgi:hypothetical protein
VTNDLLEIGFFLNDVFRIILITIRIFFVVVFLVDYLRLTLIDVGRLQVILFLVTRLMGDVGSLTLVRR